MTTITVLQGFDYCASQKTEFQGSVQPSSQRIYNQGKIKLSPEEFTDTLNKLQNPTVQAKVIITSDSPFLKTNESFESNDEAETSIWKQIAERLEKSAKNHLLFEKTFKAHIVIQTTYRSAVGPLPSKK